LNLFSYYSDEDTTVTVKDFRSVVKSLYDVKRPKGYLIPKSIPELKAWVENHRIKYMEPDREKINVIEQYYIEGIDSIDFELDIIASPVVKLSDVAGEITLSDYYFVPVNQLKNNLIVIALEPQSMLGLATYKQYEHLIKPGDKYPILRVVQ
jgi:hypothetical protein